ncbi:MAG: glycosyltransferase [Candidatus Peregrinibacteria bacterium]|nr:glycosyltransferase [Candidatus Peregrinibacteria bacterium]
MPEPLISILIPTYEPQADHLQAALDSLVQQTEQRWEVIIHDDASKVDVASIISKYLEDPRFRFIRSEVRRGIGGNWNACLQLANAPYVQFLFQDDTWEPTYLTRSLAVLEADPTIAFTAANHAYRDEAGKRAEDFAPDHNLKLLVDLKRAFLKPGKQEAQAFLSRWAARGLKPNVIGEPSFVLMRKSNIDRAGLFCEDMRQLLDLEYWVRLLKTGNWYYLAKELGAFRVHAHGASAANSERGSGIFERIRCLALVLPLIPKAERKQVESSLVDHLAEMIRAFFQRVRGGKRVSSGGSSALVAFAMKHPILTIRSVVKFITHR